jgi:hypothetical protein
MRPLCLAVPLSPPAACVRVVVAWRTQGSTVVLRDKHDASSQEFLQGHTGRVSCLALSQSGRLLASAQTTYLGFKAGAALVAGCQAATRLAKQRAGTRLSCGCPHAVHHNRHADIIIWDLESRALLHRLQLQRVGCGWAAASWQPRLLHPAATRITSTCTAPAQQANQPSRCRACMRAVRGAGEDPGAGLLTG